MTEIHRANPRLRRLTLAMALVLGLLSFLALLALARHIEGIHLDGSDEALTRGLRHLGLLLSGLLASLGLLAAGLGLWLVSLSRKVRDESRFPPASARTSFDVRVRRGPEAQSMAQRLSITGLVLVLVGLATPALALWLLLRPIAGV